MARYRRTRRKRTYKKRMYKKRRMVTRFSKPDGEYKEKIVVRDKLTFGAQTAGVYPAYLNCFWYPDPNAAAQFKRAPNNGLEWPLMADTVFRLYKITGMKIKIYPYGFANNDITTRSVAMASDLNATYAGATGKPAIASMQQYLDFKEYAWDTSRPIKRYYNLSKNWKGKRYGWINRGEYPETTQGPITSIIASFTGGAIPTKPINDVADVKITYYVVFKGRSAG